MHRLKHKVAIVTGATSGIGYATALLFAQHGARLVLNGRRRDPLAALVAHIEAAGGEALAVPGDVKDEALAESLVATAVDRFGGLDIAFNNAGIIGDMKPVTNLSMAAWRDIVDTNLTSAFLGAKYQIPAMLTRGAGSLVFTSSFVGYTAGIPGMAAYGASKAGQIGLVKTLAAAYGASGIRVNALLPGGTDTPMNLANAPDAGPEVQSFVEGLHAVKRIAAPEEIARAALFLASDASSFVTGTAFLVDGGVSICKT